MAPKTALGMTTLLTTDSVSQAATADDFWVRGRDCDLFAIRRSDSLLVTFDNLASINERSETRPWNPWLASRAEMLGQSILGVQSHHKDWYRSGEAPEQIRSLQQNGYFDRFRNIVFTGASMGAFAALCFGSLVPRAKVLAFSPQSTLNRDIAPFEKRYPYPYRKFDWQELEFLDASLYLDRISTGVIFFDPKVTEDKLHAKRLEAPRLSQVQMPFTGHKLIRVIIKAGALEHLLATYPETGKIDAQFFKLMRQRRDNERWAKPFLAAVTDRRDSRMTRRACEIMHNIHGHRFARRMRRQMIARAKD